MEADEEILRFLTGNRRDFIYKGPRSKEWKRYQGPSLYNPLVKAVTFDNPHGEITDDILLKTWRAEDRFIGLAFTEKTRFLVIDIDEKGEEGSNPYRTPGAIKQMIGLFQTYGISLYPFRSSPGSKGIHLLAVFNQAVPSGEIAHLAKDILEGKNYPWNQSGTLELYPWPIKDGKAGNRAVRLPFQAGYCLLDENLIPLPGYETQSDREKHLREFLKCCYTKADNIDGSILQLLRDPKSATSDKRKSINPSLLREGQQFYRNGLERYGQRTYACIVVKQYLIQERIVPWWDENKLIQRLTDWLTKKHNGNSKDWNDPERGPEYCYQHIQKLVHDGIHNDEKLSNIAFLYQLGESNSQKSQKRIVYLINYLLNTYGKDAERIIFRGSHINCSALERESKKLRKKSRENYGFCDEHRGIFLTTIKRETISKHRELVYATWQAWNEKQ